MNFDESKFSINEIARRESTRMAAIPSHSNRIMQIQKFVTSNLCSREENTGIRNKCKNNFDNPNNKIK